MTSLKFIISFVITFGAAAIGSLATYPSIPTWYAALDKPAFNPPNWLFGPVWTLLYTLIAISLYLIWTKKSKTSKLPQFLLFGIQIVLNAMWSIVFFGLHLPGLGFIIIVFLFATIIGMIITFKSISKPAAYLLFPYAAWIAFASCLNLGIIIVN